MNTSNSLLSSGVKNAGIGSIAYGLACYVAGVAGLGYCVLFLHDAVVPTSIDAPATLPWPLALGINLGLIVLWGLQHSAMARPRFKRWLTRFVEPHLERVTYCLASGVTLAGVCIAWQPVPGVVWNVDSVVPTLVSALGWALLLAATFAIDHFELFGLAQVWRAVTGRSEPKPEFRERWIYRFVRHPIQTGVLIGVWFTPHMSLSHLLFATAMTAYIHIGLHFEERALLREFGLVYADYMRRVPKLIPSLRSLRSLRASAQG